MGKLCAEIDDGLQTWIAAQPLWFVATAPLAGDGLVNVSPRGHDTFSVPGLHQVGWVDYTGSGIETIANLRENGRICLMFASFDRRPRIVRLHGRGRVCEPGQSNFDRVAAKHPAHPVPVLSWSSTLTGSATPAATGVPSWMVEERNLLQLYAEKKGQDGMC